MYDCNNLYVITNNDEADLLTNKSTFGENRKGFVRKPLHHILSTASAE